MPADVAYCAGLFDGEGCISASRSYHCQKNVRVSIYVTMCDRAGPEFMARTFGGHVREWKRKTRSGKAVFSWGLHCRKAAAVLELMLPYLQIKRSRAESAIKLAALSIGRDRTRTHQFSDAEISLRYQLMAVIRSENFSSNGRIARHAP
jgi:hypothetical protein